MKTAERNFFHKMSGISLLQMKKSNPSKSEKTKDIICNDTDF